MGLQILTSNIELIPKKLMFITLFITPQWSFCKLVTYQTYAVGLRQFFLENNIFAILSENKDISLSCDVVSFKNF